MLYPLSDASLLMSHNKSNTTVVRSVLLGGILCFLTACQMDKEDYVDRPVTELYTTARLYLKEGNYSKAAKAFANVERQHPYSNWALRAQIMSAYCYYQAKKYDDAIDGFQTFIQLHPSHKDVAYAYYMIGLCYYEQIPIVSRDQEPTTKAEEAFMEVINRFSTSIYAKDSKFKIDLIKDHLAAKELDIGRYYENKNSYLSALNRFKTVVETYSTTAQAPEALYRLVECYLALGLRDEAVAAAAVLGHNHPTSTWYSAAYALLNMSLPLVQPKPEEKAEAEKNAISDDILPHLMHQEEEEVLNTDPEEMKNIGRTRPDGADEFLTTENMSINQNESADAAVPIS